MTTDEQRKTAETIIAAAPCPTCTAAPGIPCVFDAFERLGDIHRSRARAAGVRVVRVFAADENPTPEVSIMVSGKFPREPSGTTDWPKKHMERFHADAHALEDALVTTLPGGTLDQLTSLLLARKASKLVVRDFTKPPDPPPLPETTESTAAGKPDSIVVITVLTANPELRDQIDQAIDRMFTGDERVHLVRVVGYPPTADIAHLSRKIDKVTG